MAREPSIGDHDNDHIRHGITDIYADFVRQVDPSGHIFDYLIQNRIVKVEIVEKWRGIAGPQDRCRAMINELLVRGNPTAFVVLREALEEDHDHIVQKIDEKTAAYGVHKAEGSELATEVKRSKSTDAPIEELTKELEHVRVELRKLTEQNEELKNVIKTMDYEMRTPKEQLDVAKATDAESTDRSTNTSVEAPRDEVDDNYVVLETTPWGVEQHATALRGDCSLFMNASSDNTAHGCDYFLPVEVNVIYYNDVRSASANEFQWDTSKAENYLQSDVPGLSADDNDTYESTPMYVENPYEVVHLREAQKSTPRGTTAADDEDLYTDVVSRHSLVLKSQPVLKATISDRAALSTAVVGLALLDNKLFVVCKNSFNVVVYNTEDQYQLLRLIKLPPPPKRHSLAQLLKGGSTSSPSDIAACPANCYLYIGIIGVQNGIVVAIQLQEKPGAMKLNSSEWGTDGQPRGISVTRNNNVLVCCSEECHVSEYSPTGKPIRRLKLWQEIDHPWCAVELNDGVWVVSHGANSQASSTSTSHRVCFIDVRLKQMIHSHGGAPGADKDQLSEPRSLVVDVTGRVWVADYRNNRVKVLDASSGDNDQELLNADDKLSGPTSLCLNNNDGLLYIGQRNGKILVFQALDQGL